jgi:hypothetical protein
MTEINLCLPKLEMWECFNNKESAAALPRRTSAICLTIVRRISATEQMILAFMTTDNLRKPA